MSTSDHTDETVWSHAIIWSKDVAGWTFTLASLGDYDTVARQSQDPDNQSWHEMASKVKRVVVETFPDNETLSALDKAWHTNNTSQPFFPTAHSLVIRQSAMTELSRHMFFAPSGGLTSAHNRSLSSIQSRDQDKDCLFHLAWFLNAKEVCIDASSLDHSAKVSSKQDLNDLGGIQSQVLHDFNIHKLCTHGLFAMPGSHMACIDGTILSSTHYIDVRHWPRYLLQHREDIPASRRYEYSEVVFPQKVLHDLHTHFGVFGTADSATLVACNYDQNSSIDTLWGSMVISTSDKMLSCEVAAPDHACSICGTVVHRSNQARANQEESMTDVLPEAVTGLV